MPVQSPVHLHGLPTEQCSTDTRRESGLLLQTAKKHIGTLTHLHRPQQGLQCRIELTHHTITHQQHWRRMVKNGGLLLQQLAQAHLLLAFGLLLVQAVGYILLQTNQGHTLALGIEDRRDGDILVVWAAIAAAVDKLPLPGMACHHGVPHVVVGLGGRTATGQHRWLAPTHLCQAIAGVALKLWVDPLDDAVGIGHNHGQWVVL